LSADLDSGSKACGSRAGDPRSAGLHKRPIVSATMASQGIAQERNVMVTYEPSLEAPNERSKCCLQLIHGPWNTLLIVRPNAQATLHSWSDKQGIRTKRWQWQRKVCDLITQIGAIWLRRIDQRTQNAGYISRTWREVVLGRGIGARGHGPSTSDPPPAICGYITVRLHPRTPDPQTSESPSPIIACRLQHNRSLNFDHAL